MTLRPYQSKLVADIHRAWNQGASNVLAVLPTGGGKTRTFAHIVGDWREPSVAIAHRNELVSQISLAYAATGIRHRIIAARDTVREIVNQHIIETGHSYYDPSANAAVAGVDTLIRRDANADPWFRRVTLWAQDEAHHLLAENKWGTAAKMFPNARGLGVTATPLRADGKGLGRHADGLMDAMVEGPGMRDLIRMGYLSDYRIFAPPSDLDLSDVPLGADGDFSLPKARAAHRKSHLVGDIVESYLRIAPGKLGVTFTWDVESATETAQRYRDAGVPSEVVSAKTPLATRAAILRRFRARDILQLVNVDLFGEGFDLPAIEVVSMGRASASFGLVCQQFGRALRPLEGKREAIIIDHVSNLIRHAETRGLPDSRQIWSLDRRGKRSSGKSDAIPIRACPACTQVYERFNKTCPHCGYYPEPASRSGPEHVDGDLTELDAETLARLRREADPPLLIPRGASPIVEASVKKNHRLRQAAQASLREAISWWAGARRDAGATDSRIYREFYHRFGVDIATAQTLSRGDTEMLDARLRAELDSDGIVIKENPQ